LEQALRVYLEEWMVSVMEYHAVDLEVDWNEVLMMAFPLTGMCYYQTEEMGLSDLD
jgi:hypothetical protein